METLITVFLCFPYLSLGEFGLSFVIVFLFVFLLYVLIFLSHNHFRFRKGRLKFIPLGHLPVKNKLIAFSNLCFIVGDSEYSRV